MKVLRDGGGKLSIESQLGNRLNVTITCDQH